MAGRFGELRGQGGWHGVSEGQEPMWSEVLVGHGKDLGCDLEDVRSCRGVRKEGTRSYLSPGGSSGCCVEGQ